MHDSPTPRTTLVIALLAAGTFLMGTTEFVVAGILPEIASAFGSTVPQAGLTITVFAIGMIVGAPAMALLTLKLPARATLAIALSVFAAGHVVVVLTDDFGIVLAARFVTALATGAFWAVAAVVATRLAGPGAGSRALGLVLGGGMLANVLGVPIGAFAGQVLGWQGPFWALAVVALVLIAPVHRLIPSAGGTLGAPSVRAELGAFVSARIWLALATCVVVNAGVMSIYSFVSPLLTDRTGLPSSFVPVALLLFGIGALAGNVVGGRLGDARPFAAPLAMFAITLVASGALIVLSDVPAPTVVLLTALGLVGFSANPILVHLVVRYGGDAPTLPSAMATSMFNLGTAIGSGITAAALAGPLGAVAPPLVGAAFGVLVFVPFLALRAADRRVPAGPEAVPAVAS